MGLAGIAFIDQHQCEEFPSAGTSVDNVKQCFPFYIQFMLCLTLQLLFSESQSITRAVQKPFEYEVHVAWCIIKIFRKGGGEGWWMGRGIALKDA